jgi:PAS domain S-box-containing protein
MVESEPIDSSPVRRAMAGERLLNAGRITVLRFWSVSAFFLLFLVLGGVLRLATWTGNLRLFAVYWVITAFIWQRSRRSTWSPHVSALTIAILDAPMVFLLQWATFPTSNPSGVAGFTAGIYVLLVILATLSLRTWYIMVTAAVATVYEIWLQYLADVSPGAMVATAILLGLAATACSYWRYRVVALVERVESERRYHEAFERSPAGIFRIREDGRITDCNEAFAQALGFERASEVLSANSREFYVDPAAGVQLLERARDEERVVNAELQLRRRDGGRIWALTNMVPAAGQPRGEYEGTLIDITAHKRSEELRSVTSLANAAAHEINNPLTVVLGRLELLAGDASLDPKTRGPIAQALTAAERIGEIVAAMQQLTQVDWFEHSAPGLPAMIDLRKSTGPPGSRPTR